MKSRLRCFEPLESRQLLAGVTVITHGFQSGDVAPDWGVTMGQAILDRADGARTDRLTGSIFQHDPDSGTWQPLAPTIWSNSNRADEHVVLIYDWAQESDFFENGWLEAAADNLFANLVRRQDELSGQLAGQSFHELACDQIDPCQSLDFHFIGHSRGAVLNSRVTERFGYYFGDQTVNQVTSLDPHPASVMNDPGYVSSNPSSNSRLFTYTNVDFADNYYRQDLFYELDGDFDGVFAEGAYNLQIPESVLSGAGSSFEHLDVHTWYYGSITEPFDAAYAGFSGTGRNNDGDVSFPENWYGVANVPARDQAGFYYSRIGAGDRSALSATGTPSSPAALASVVNGDFQFGNNDAPDQVPGWQYHGGQFQADFENGAMHLGPADFVTATHNPLYVPDWAESLRFDYEVRQTSATESLDVSLDDLPPLGTLALNDTGIDVAQLDLLATTPGSVATLNLQLVTPGLVGADLLIDNIRFVAGPALPGDFSDDGSYGCSDVDPLVAAVAGDADLAAFDLNDDQVVDLADLDRWLQLAGAATLPSGQPFPFGDANLDGLVNGQDFSIWNNHRFTATAAWCAGDFTADGFVDGRDLLVWNSNKVLMPGMSRLPAATAAQAVQRANGDGESNPTVVKAAALEPHRKDGAQLRRFSGQSRRGGDARAPTRLLDDLDIDYDHRRFTDEQPS